jgi:predicted DNA binding protein
MTAFTADFRSHPAVERFERVAGEDDDSIAYFASEISYESENPSILSLIHDKGCFQHNTVSVKQGLEQWKVYTEDAAAVQELVDELEALGNEVSLYRSMDMESLVESASFDIATMLTELTARQQAVLEVALSLGYYDADVDVTTEDVAAEFDLHQSTVWEHLTKAENTILQTVGQQLASEKSLESNQFAGMTG